MRVYLAARYDRKAELRGYRDDLIRLGHIVTASWLDEGPHEEAHNWAPDDTLYRRFALAAYRDLLTSDVSFHFTETPTPDPVGGAVARGGRHVEMGIALEISRRGRFQNFPGPPHRIAIVGPRENVFHYLPHLDVYPRWAPALADLGRAP